MAPATYTPRCRERRVTLSCRISCALRSDRLVKSSGYRGSGGHTDVDTSLSGGGRSRYARHGKPRIGWNGRIGLIPSYRGRMKSVTDCFTFLMCLALALNGTRTPSRPTEPICRLIVS